MLPINFFTLLDMLGGDTQRVSTLLQTFLKELASDLESSQLALESGDMGSLRKIAHRVKGTSANLHATLVSAAARELEQACIEGTASAVAATQRVMQEQGEILMDAIRDWQQRLATSA